MGNKIYIILFLLGLLVGCNVKPTTSSVVSGAITTEFKSDTRIADTVKSTSKAISSTYPILIGDYLSVEYINVLQKTRSPLTAAEESDGRQFINGKMLDNKPNFTIMGGFHEGLGGFGIDYKGDLNPGIHGMKFAGSRILSDKEFVLKFDDKDLTYRYVGNLNQFVASQTIVGKYKSDMGELYTFTVEGTATYPGKTFQYKVFSDYVMVGFDSFFEVTPKGGGKVYGFKLIKNKLQLFNMGGPMGDEPEDKPFVTLTRIKDE